MASRRQPYTPCKLYIDGAEGLSAGDATSSPLGDLRTRCKLPGSLALSATVPRLLAVGTRQDS